MLLIINIYNISDSNINRNDLIILVAHRSDPTDQMFVFFIDERRFGVKNILTYSSQMQEQHVKNAILVFQQGLTNAAKQAITELDSQFNFEFFTEKDLIINITDHCLQPKFRLMTAEEKKSICQKYKISESQLPKIQQSDPLARYFGLKKGDVLNIVRTSQTAGRYTTYRICI
ncbi:MAG: DNA-directed RNA polymerases I, II, and III subunit RPABC1 [Marteilia pararefringens]